MKAIKILLIFMGLVFVGLVTDVEAYSPLDYIIPRPIEIPYELEYEAWVTIEFYRERESCFLWWCRTVKDRVYTHNEGIKDPGKHVASIERSYHAVYSGSTEGKLYYTIRLQRWNCFRYWWWGSKTWCRWQTAKETTIGIGKVKVAKEFDNRPEWTFMVYLDGDNDLEEDGIDDFQEMASVGSGENVNIVVQFDRVPRRDNSFGDWTTTHRFLITPGMTPTEENAISDWGDGSGGREVNMADPQTLVDFVDWARDNYPAKHYALIIWNHGGGWRDVAPEKPMCREICWDETSDDDTLFMKELQTALNTITEGKPTIDLLGFDACLMGMAEVAYEIQDFAIVMVGAEQTEPPDGWPYDTILSDLIAVPTMTARDFGVVIVNRYGEAYGSNENTTQAAVNLGMMDSLADSINNFVTAIISADKTEIAKARSMSQQYYYWEHIDLYDFAELVSTETANSELHKAANAVLVEIEDAVLAEYHGAVLPDSHGLAIYFPEEESYFDLDYLKEVIDFPFATSWGRFLLSYHYPEFLLSANNKGTIDVCFSQGKGAFGPPISVGLELGVNYGAFAIADFNDDGLLDFIASSTRASTEQDPELLYLFRRTGTASFQQCYLAEIEPDPKAAYYMNPLGGNDPLLAPDYGYGLIAADLDNDGDMDFLENINQTISFG